MVEVQLACTTVLLLIGCVDSGATTSASSEGTPASTTDGSSGGGSTLADSLESTATGGADAILIT